MQCGVGENCAKCSTRRRPASRNTLCLFRALHLVVSTIFQLCHAKVRQEKILLIMGIKGKLEHAESLFFNPFVLAHFSILTKSYSFPLLLPMPPYTPHQNKQTNKQGLEHYYEWNVCLNNRQVISFLLGSIKIGSKLSVLFFFKICTIRSNQKFKFGLIWSKTT